MAQDDPLSVLVVEEEPAILGFLASLLDSNGIRALLARSVREAMEIARRGYVPIDLVLTDIVVKESFDSDVSEVPGAEVLNRLRQIRPDVRVLYMSAYMDGSMIRIQPMGRRGVEDGKLPQESLIESIRAAASTPLTFGSGGAPSP